MNKALMVVPAALTALFVASGAHAVVVGGGGGSPPDCSQAGPSVPYLWPPDHKFTDVTITGVTDPGGLPVTITINSIQQDEPVDVKGSGNTAPDGHGIGGSVAYLRAERSGTGEGRLYFVNFNAIDTAGGTCTGSVSVGVPHDMGQGIVPVDTGQRYDSTATQ